jgi:hypothetical protein
MSGRARTLPRQGDTIRAMSRVTPTSARPEAPGVCCVLWAKSGSTLPAALLRVLEQRRLTLVTVHHRFEAVARVSKAHASARVMAEDASAGRGPILVLVEPQELDGASEVFRTIEMSAPGALCWRYCQASTPKLGMFLPSEWPEASGQPRHDPTPRVVVMPGVEALGRGAGPIPIDKPKLTLRGVEPEWTERAPIPSESPNGGSANMDRGHGANIRTPAAYWSGDVARTPSGVPPESIPGRSGPIRMTPLDPEGVQGTRETSDHHGHDDLSRSAPVRPHERSDFSRIITEDELTMLLADREPNS